MLTQNNYRPCTFCETYCLRYCFNTSTKVQEKYNYKIDVHVNSERCVLNFRKILTRTTKLFMQNDIYFGVLFTSNSILIRNVLITTILFVYDVVENMWNGILQLKCKNNCTVNTLVAELVARYYQYCRRYG